MQAERWRQVTDLFDDVVDAAEEERQERLRQIGERDPALADEVASLLADEARLGTFLQDPGVAVPEETLPARLDVPEAGDHLGRYRLEREIGQGGAGLVFLAQRADREYEHQVAIKVLKPGLVGRQAIARLRTERQILASLDHPSIAKLHDGGTTESQLPFVVMEWVDGLPIDQYCDQGRASLRQRLALMREVCAAVHCAHQNLIVHRDLKPSNILVTADGRPKLLDFGIAKLLDPERIPASGEPTVSWLRLMTPNYASPEQVQGQPVTTATDVYALGVLLFKLLTGLLPFDVSGKSLAEAERLICEQDPPRPSVAVERLPRDAMASDVLTLVTISRDRSSSPKSLRRWLRGDLDRIVLCALAKDPGRRYASVERLSEDLRRYLEGLPVTVRGDSFSYRLGKLIRRNRLAAALAASGAVLLFAWAISATVLLKRISVERDTKEEILGYVKDVFRLVDPEEAPGEQWTLQEALDRKSSNLATELPDPAARAELLGFFGQIYLSQGQLAKSRDLLEQARGLWGTVPDHDGEELIATLGNLSAVQRELGETEDALELSEEAVHRARDAVSSRPEILIEPLSEKVAVLCYRGEFDRAAEVNREVLALTGKLLAQTDRQHIAAVTTRAYIHRRRDELEAAIRDYREALRLHRLASAGDHPLVADVLANLGAALHFQGNYEEAEEVGAAALAMRRRILPPNHTSLAQSLSNLSKTLEKRDAYAEAEEALVEALGILRQHAEDSHPRLISTQTSLARLQLAGGRPERAVASLPARLEQWRIDRPEDAVRLASAESILGAAYAAVGRCGEARLLLSSSLTTLTAELGEEHRRTSETRDRLEEMTRVCG